MRSIKKKHNITNKKADLETILRDYEVKINEPIENGNCLLHLLIMEQELDSLKLVLNLPEDFKTQKADPNLIDKKYSWSPLVTAVNQGPSGYYEGIFELLRAKADPN